MEIGFCTAQEKKWCKRIKREESGGLSASIGVMGCYRPEDDIICVGAECFLINWNDMWKQGLARKKPLKFW